MFLRYAGFPLVAAFLITAAEANEALATKSNCFTCHRLDSKLIGPSYKEVALKYKDRKDAVEYLSEKIKKGGSGVWGPVPMIPNTAVKDEDIKTLAIWIMSLNKTADKKPAAPAKK